MGSNYSMDSPWAQTFSKIQSKHDAAYRAIETAITLEEREKPNEAIEEYKRGIAYIDEALSVQVTCPETTDASWEKALTMIQKMKKTRAEVLTRINSIQSSPNYIRPEDPPSYEEAVSSSASSSQTDGPITYKDLATALQELSVDPNMNLSEQLLFSCEGVKLYFISSSGEASSTGRDETLKIFLLNDESGTDNAPRAVLHIGDWVYPLVPGVSPCYRSDYGAFILPNVYAEEVGASVGFIVPRKCDEDLYDILENILHGIVGESPQKIELPPREPDLSHKISSGILNGAYYISKGLIHGAEKAGDFISYGTPKIIGRVRPANRPKAVPRRLSKGIEIAENVTGKAAEVSGFVAEKVGLATTKLGRFLAPHIQRQGTRLLTNFNMSEEEASDRMKGVLTVAAGAVEAFSTVYGALETSASILGRNLKDNTVKIVEYKYGPQAGECAEGTLTTVGNAYVIAQNTKCITPKGFAKRAAKETGKTIVEDYGLNTPSTSQSGLPQLEEAEDNNYKDSTSNSVVKKE